MIEAAGDDGSIEPADGRGVFRVAPSGMVTQIAAGFVSPAGIVVDPADRIFVADSGARVVYVIDQPLARRRAIR